MGPHSRLSPHRPAKSPSSLHMLGLWLADDWLIPRGMKAAPELTRVHNVSPLCQLTNQELPDPRLSLCPSTWKHPLPGGAARAHVPGHSPSPAYVPTEASPRSVTVCSAFQGFQINQWDTYCDHRWLPHSAASHQERSCLSQRCSEGLALSESLADPCWGD